jgi:phospholipid N-methyltransferase
VKVPAELEATVYRAYGAAFGAPPSPAELHHAIADRSRRSTSERAALAARPRHDLAARALFFTVCDAMKIAVPFGELARANALPDRPLRVVDLGAGCGAMSLGLVHAGARIGELTLVDTDAGALAIAKRALPASTTVVADATTAAIPPADLIVCGTMLNELPEAAHLPLVTRALAALADDGALILVEPALRDTTRALHRLRDALLGRAFVAFPCTHQQTCPALVNPDDWCHEDRTVDLPPRTAELARVTHLRDDGLKFSYLVLRRQPLAVPAGAWRLVSAPRIAKGKHEITGCGEPGWRTLRLLKRHRTGEHRAFERAHRGDTVVAEEPAGPERVDLVAPPRVIS